jgi:hypothetical protein
MKALRCTLCAALAAAFLLASARATTTYALTEGGAILTFDHATPGVLADSETITGLGTYELLAIDVRPTVQASPANPGAGSLWGIGKSGTNFQLFVIDPATGVATAIGSPIAAGINSVPANTAWGFDFIPTADRIRLVNSSGADNYRLNPNTGTLVFTDPDLAYISGDVNFGATPQVDGGAYTTAPFGGTSQLYYLDTALDILVRSPGQTLGQLQTVGPLGIDITEPNGFDIYGSLALFTAPGVVGSNLYAVNLSTGAATLVGAFPPATAVRGLAISISDPIDQRPVVTLIGPALRTTRATRANVRFRATDDSGVVAASFRAVRQSASFRSVQSATSVFTARVRGLELGNNPVFLRATDPAGRKAQVRMVIRRVP